MLTCSYLPTKLQTMLLLFNKSESPECAKVVVLKLGATLFYSGIHFKSLKLWKKISQRSEYAHSTKDKRIRLVGTCRKVPLVVDAYCSLLKLTTKRVQDIVLRQTVPHISNLTVRKYRRLAVQKLPRQNRGEIFSRNCRKFDLSCVNTISV